MGCGEICSPYIFWEVNMAKTLLSPEEITWIPVTIHKVTITNEKTEYVGKLWSGFFGENGFIRFMEKDFIDITIEEDNNGQEKIGG